MFTLSIAAKASRHSLFIPAVAVIGGLSALSKGVEAEKSSETKLDIYDPKEFRKETPAVVKSPASIEQTVRTTRLTLQEGYNSLRDAANNTRDKFFKYENKVADYIGHTIPKKESGSLLFVGVSGLAGLVVANRRGFILRFLTPVAFTTFAAGYFMPETFSKVVFDVRGKTQQLCQSAPIKPYYDQVCSTFEAAEERLKTVTDTATEHTSVFVHKVKQEAGNVKKSLVDLVQGK